MKTRSAGAKFYRTRNGHCTRLTCFIMINAVIYEITSANHPRRYVGATTRPLSKRICKHRNSRDCTSRLLFEVGGVSWRVLQYVTCDSVEVLEDIEAAYILQDRDGCVNKTIPGAKRRAGGSAAYFKKRDASAKRLAYEKERGQRPERKEKQRAAGLLRREFSKSCDGLNQICF